MVARNIWLGAALAAGVLLLVPGVAGALARAGRPIVKSGIKSGVNAYREAQKAGAEAYERIEDIVAEVRAEMIDEDRPLDPGRGNPEEGAAGEAAGRG